MAITHTADGTYTVTLGTRQYTGYPTLQAAQEAQYDLQRGHPAPDLVADVLKYVVGDNAVTHALGHMEDEPDGPYWDTYTRGDVRLHIEGIDGGSLHLGPTELLEIDGAGAAGLLDLRAVLNDPRVVAALERVYNAD